MKLIKKPTHINQNGINTATFNYISMLRSNKYSKRIPATFSWKVKTYYKNSYRKTPQSHTTTVHNRSTKKAVREILGITFADNWV